MHGHCNSPFTINSRFNIWLDWRDTANKLLLVGRNVVSSLIMQNTFDISYFFVKGITFIIWTHRRGSKMINRFLNNKIEMKGRLMRVWKHWRLYKRHNAHNILRYWLIYMYSYSKWKITGRKIRFNKILRVSNCCFSVYWKN